MKSVTYFFAFFCLVTSIATADISDGLIGYWPFDGNADDASGNGHDGTVYGAILTSDRYGNPESAYRFNGNNYISVPDDDSFTLGSSTFTLSAWMQFSENGSYYMMGHDEGEGNINKWIFWPNTSGVTFHINRSSGGSSWPITYSDWSTNLDTWYHLAIVRDGNNYSLYIDGEEVSTGVDTGSIPNPNAPLLFGDAESGHPERNFKGVLDEIRIYNRALSSDEIDELVSYETFYYEQTVPFIDPTQDFVFIKNRHHQNAWAGEDYGAIRVVAVNDNQDSQGLGTPPDHFTGNQGLVVAYDVLDESGNGAVCALGAEFPQADGGPGYSSLPASLKDTTLHVDIAFQIPENPSIETLTETLSFWLIEADGDEFETEGIIDLGREWQTYIYDVNDLAEHIVDASGGGTFGDSPVTLFALQFEDPNNLSDISSIIYSIDNFKISGQTVSFFEDYEDQCPVMPIGDLNADCRVNMLDLAILARHWLEEYTYTDRIAIINPDHHRILKYGIRRTADYYSLAHGVINDSGSGGIWTDFANPVYWSAIGQQSDFIGSILENAGFAVDYYEADQMPAISRYDYAVVIVQDPLRTNLLQFTAGEVENASLDLLEYVTDSTFLSRMDTYIKTGGNVVLSGDAVKLLENGPGRLNYGKSIQEKRAAHTATQPHSRIPEDWLFVRGNPFCGVDRTGSGTYTVQGGSLLSSGTVFSQLQLANLNDQPTCETWSDTAYYPSDGISLMDVQVTGSGQYVLSGAVCSPPVYSVSVNDTIPNFMGYTHYNEYTIYYIASDSLFDYQNTNYIGKWHVNQYSRIKNEVTPEGENAIVALVNHILGQ